MVMSPFTHRSWRPSPFRSLAEPGHGHVALKCGRGVEEAERLARRLDAEVHRLTSFDRRVAPGRRRAIVAGRAASRAAFVSVTFAPKIRPNWTIPTTIRAGAAAGRPRTRPSPGRAHGVAAATCRLALRRVQTLGLGQRRLEGTGPISVSEGAAGRIVGTADWCRYRPLGAVRMGRMGGSPRIAARIDLHARPQGQRPVRADGDQPTAIAELVDGVGAGLKHQVLLGATGTGKTFTAARLIEAVQKPTLVMAHNKTLAAQLYQEFKEFFPENAVEYFVSYYDYFQPEAYLPRTDTYIEKDSSRNDEIDRLRHNATRALFERRDVVIVASVSAHLRARRAGRLRRDGHQPEARRALPARRGPPPPGGPPVPAQRRRSSAAPSSGSAATSSRSSRRTASTSCGSTSSATRSSASSRSTT